MKVSDYSNILFWGVFRSSDRFSIQVCMTHQFFFLDAFIQWKIHNSVHMGWLDLRNIMAARITFVNQFYRCFQSEFTEELAQKGVLYHSNEEGRFSKQARPSCLVGRGLTVNVIHTLIGAQFDVAVITSLTPWTFKEVVY